ncbi:integrator complex subunit 1-like [Brachionus plicatilis]|uniref:Integrator complex subunit 1-like n=1 Tax=Brachionus plicatilis TaxID=10195 RepID=A0A3M7QTJ4_BRAPC|nr:integrator complex subunit 1-like [Brachionus plicatilis]
MNSIYNLSLCLNTENHCLILRFCCQFLCIKPIGKSCLDAFTKLSVFGDLNQSTVLEFLNSLIHLPTFSKVDKIELSQPKCCMISFLNLTEDQFAQLIDILIEEMFIVYLSVPDQNDLSSDFKSYLDNRIELLFCNMYQLFDKPTELDLKTHNLLNCFGEIEVNFSYNLTSSGIIGVAVTSGSSKQKSENQEMVQLAKKQEEFMVDANFVCIKLASSHPYIFIRQLPMMEGMLQGRVGYSFDEFKKRKFDKLFHYIIDILNILVPFVFHQKYRSYCEENREFIGSLVIKFCEFLERFVNTDLESGYFEIIKKYCNIIGLKIAKMKIYATESQLNDEIFNFGFLAPKPNYMAFSATIIIKWK